MPYDSNGVWVTYETGGTADCPANETVSGGDHVWLESECNTITLDKYVDGSSGMIYYTADVSLDDYCFDQVYALHTEGDPNGLPEEIVEEIIPKSLKIQLYKAMLDSHAAEHGARMTAMHKATDNADSLLKELKLTYNKARQASITNEILEIVGGAEALKG